jgi:hypothetical protein
LREKGGEANLSNPMLEAIVIEVAGKWKCPMWSMASWQNLYENLLEFGQEAWYTFHNFFPPLVLHLPPGADVRPLYSLSSRRCLKIH